MERPPSPPPAAHALLAKLAAALGAPAALPGATALLRARLGAAPSAAGEEALVKRAISRLFLAGRNADATRYARLSAALMSDPALRAAGGTSAPVTYLLTALADGAAAPDAVGAFEPPQGAALQARGAAGDGAGDDVDSNGAKDDGAEDDDDDDDDDDDSEDDDDEHAEYYDDEGRPTAAAHRAARGAPASFEVPPLRRRTEERRDSYAVRPQSTPAVTSRTAEVVLVRDVMLVVQGGDGRFVRFARRANAATTSGGGEEGEDEDEGEGEGVGEGADAWDADVAVEILPLEGAVGGGGSVRSLPVSASTAHLVRYISELGFLFNVVNRRLRTVDERPGLVATNFCAAVDREMEAYYRSLAALNTGVDTSDDCLPSLRAVYVWAEAEKPRLRWLARLCDETRALVGGQTLAHLRSYHRSYVAEDIHAMLSRIIARTAAPLDLMLIRWVTEGVLVDPHGEFYIMESATVAAAAAKVAAASAASGAALIEAPERFDRMLAGGPNAASSASHRIWWGLFVVRRDMIPGVQSRRVVENTLIAGKSIAFLRRCCGDALWVDQVHAPALSKVLAERPASGTDGGGDVSGRGFSMGSGLLDQDPRLAGTDHVAELVSHAVRSASVRLKTLFFDKFDLSHHFAAIKNYLLLSQGDFTQALMDSLAPLLDGDGRILRNNITGLLDAALRGSSSFNPETDGDIAERLDVQIMAQSGDECVGWDVFSLTYRVEDAPLNTVFSTKVMDAYLEIFRFLWRLKRMDYVLSNAYMELREMGDKWRRRRKLRATEGYAADATDADETAAEETVSEVFARAHFLRMKMAHVLQNVQYYCTFEVLEGNWKVLSDEMTRAQDINTLISAHSRYLGAIKDRTFLSKRSQTVARALDSVLNTIISFRATQQGLCLWSAQLHDTARLTGLPESHVPASRMDEIHRLSTHLRTVEVAFDEGLDCFLGDLAGHARAVGSSRFLAFRLDYNGFFARRSRAARSATAASNVNGASNSALNAELEHPVSADIDDHADAEMADAEDNSPGASDVAVDSGNALDPIASAPIAR